ncbi:type I-E CRISPR-associated protein Cas5/CasD [Acetobacteraceae bacterium H6797]|nr:type I-E CRISPR-associated protein Cas5/CasD [Acetobacteraceae bacterium H6797]
MPAFLTFALIAPMASFGAPAVGERRESWSRPGRSAVLGLVGACLGLEREDDAAQAALAADYGLALLCVAAGKPFADFHTAEVPSASRKTRHATRAEELAVPKHQLNTILSRRDYRTGAWHLAALWARGASPRWSLSELAEAMQAPGFTTYLGRKSCPLGLPLAPRVDEEAPDAPAALRARFATGPEAGFAAWLALAEEPKFIAMDAEGAPAHAHRIETRRDQPRLRRAWQFDLRREAILGFEEGA